MEDSRVSKTVKKSANVKIEAKKVGCSAYFLYKTKYTQHSTFKFWDVQSSVVSE